MFKFLRSYDATQTMRMKILPDSSADKQSFDRIKTFDWRRLSLNLFVIFHLSVLFVCGMPGTFPLKEKAAQFLRPYALRMGLWQSWDMFAPEPLTLNAYLEAEVEFSDGSTRIWTFPRVSEMGVIDKMINERYRKWAVDNIRLDKHSLFWADTARYVARKTNTVPGNPPQKVFLWRYWHPIEAPQRKYVPAGYRARAGQFQKYKFFSYRVTAEDVR